MSKYETVKFVEAISNPVHVYELDEDGTRVIATFVCPPGGCFRGSEKMPQSINATWPELLGVVKPMKNMRLAIGKPRRGLEIRKVLRHERH